MTKNILTQSAPEAQGIASSAILNFVNAVDANIDSLHSFMLLRHGHIVAQGWWSPYAPELPHTLFSLSKSFTSTAVGLAVTEGLLSIENTVLSFFPEDAPPEISANLAAMRVRHLLSMVTGHAEDTLNHLFEDPDGNWVRTFLALPVEHKPGTHFIYNTGASYVLSAIVQKLTGMTLLDYLTPRLFEPLGIEAATWGTCPRGINFGGFGLDIKTEDIAKFGQLCLQQGMWQGQRILSAVWINEATAAQVPNGPSDKPDWEQGYGYQFWRCQPQNAYRGDGAFGQYCIVLPDQDAVIAITSGVGDMQAVLNLIWEHLLPAMGPIPLLKDTPAQTALEQELSSLAMTPQQGPTSSPVEAQISGKHYRFEENEQGIKAITLDFTSHPGDKVLLALHDTHAEHQIMCGQSAWVTGVTALGDGIAGPVAASGAWTDEAVYTIKLCFYQTPFCPTVTCRFVDDQLLFNFKDNVSFGPLERPQLVGKLK